MRMKLQMKFVICWVLRKSLLGLRIVRIGEYLRRKSSHEYLYAGDKRTIRILRKFNLSVLLELIIVFVECV